MLSANTIKVVDAYWANHLGCSVADMNATTATAPLVLEHSTKLADYNGLYIFTKTAAVSKVSNSESTCMVISAPKKFVAQLKEVTRLWTVQSAMHVGFLKEKLAFVQPKKFIGPAYIGYTDTVKSFDIPNTIIRLLNERDLEKIATFRNTVDATEWDHGGSDVRKDRVLGVFVEEELVAVTGYKIWGSVIAHISIVVYSTYRSGGYGKLAVCAIVQDALEHKLIPQYQTLLANQSSVGVARAHHFTHYTTTISIPLN